MSPPTTWSALLADQVDTRAALLLHEMNDTRDALVIEVTSITGC